jgi:hypothetical protein
MIDFGLMAREQAKGDTRNVQLYGYRGALPNPFATFSFGLTFRENRHSQNNEIK